MERLNPSSSRFLVFGASGLVGKEILKHLPPSETIAYAYKNLSKSLVEFDVTDTTRLKDEIIQRRPEVVFWAVNMPGGVNGCETNPDRAKVFHLDTTQAIVSACVEMDSALVFISSDYVFSDSERAIPETATPHPLNLYGKLKSQSEEIIQTALKKYIIARTTNVYGWDPESKTPNFYMQAFHALSKNEPVVAPSCLHGNPTYVADLVEALLQLLKVKKYGLYHIVGPENVSRHDWAVQIAASLGKNPALIHDSQNFQNIPKRPLKIELSTLKIRDAVPYHPKTIQNGLNTLNEIRNKPRHD